MKHHEIAITRTTILPGDPQAVFAFIAAEDVLPKVLTGYGPLPAVVSTSGHTGAWDRPGSERVVHLADGSTVREQVTSYRPPDRFAYRVWDFGHPVLRLLATEARGDWTFQPVPGGTQVAWAYSFRARNAWTALPLAGVSRLLWQGYMDVCLANAQRLLAQRGAPA